MTHIKYDVRITGIEFSIVILWIGNGLEILQEKRNFRNKNNFIDDIC